MYKFKNLLFYFTIFFFFTSCGDVAKTLRNEKVITTDEFLVKKRDPLSLPPDYDKVPTPGSVTEKQNKENTPQKIEKIFKIEEEKSSSSNTSGSVENSILEKIKK